MRHCHGFAAGHADIGLRARGLGTGALPLLALLQEIDLVTEYLPKPGGLPHIELLAVAKQFELNDRIIRCFVSPWGPLPGMDDVHELVVFDLMDEEEKAILVYAESPRESAKEHRNWPVPPVKSLRRKVGSSVRVSSASLCKRPAC